MQFAKKHWITLFIIPILLLGLIFVFFITADIQKSELEKRQNRLENVHEDAVAKITHSIENFATLVSGIRSYVEKRDTIPSAHDMVDYIDNLLEDLEYKDSIIVSYLDTNHTFIYTLTRNQLDPAKLTGKNVADLRDEEEIENLNEIMQDHDLHLFEPINLIEGWQGIPLNFGIQRKGINEGYIASIINFKYIIQPIYENSEVKDDFVFRFHIPNGPEFDREQVYDDETVFNSNTDEEYYKNFVSDTSDFYYSTIKKYGLSLRVGTAYKKPHSESSVSVITIYFWYFTFCVFMIIIAYQLRKTRNFNAQLTEANNHIQSKNRSIEESLNFGKSTQSALLTSKTYLNNTLDEYFIFYQPKGVVGGDFYWVHQTAEHLLFAVVDCTGHGVSGALMSIVGNRLLNEIVKEKQITDPAETLNQMRDAIIQGFDSAEDQSISSHGMDMSFCTYHYPTKTLNYAGGNSSIILKTVANSISILSGKDQTVQHQAEYLELKGNRQAVGKDLRKDEAFTNVKLQLKDEFCVYLYSDGFEDQFDGKQHKRYGHERFINFIIQQQNVSLSSQKELFRKEFENWKGDLEQIDDICVFALKIS